MLREDEIEALCKLHGASLTVSTFETDRQWWHAAINIFGGLFPYTGTSDDSRSEAVQEAWLKFNQYQKRTT